MTKGPHSLADLSPEAKRRLLAELLRDKGNTPASALSYGQRALWYLHRLDPTSAFYNVPWTWLVRSDISVDVLERAFQTILDRHRILRTSYPEQNGRPAVRVNEHARIDFSQIDVAGVDDRELHARILSEAHRPFDLDNGSILRVRLFTRAAAEHVLLVTFHHIAYDLWSMMTLLDELGALYDAYKKGAQPALAPVKQYDEFVRWQSDLLAKPEGERLWQYWQKQLGGEPPVVSLPLDHARPAVQTFSGATCTTPIPDPIAAGLRDLSQKTGQTLFTILLSAYHVLLARYTGQNDIVVGSPLAGRTRPEHQNVIGYCLNALPMRGDLSGDPTFVELLNRNRQVVLGALDHQDYPFALLVERLRPARDPSHATFFHVMFSLNKPHRREEQALSLSVLGGAGRVELGGLALEFYPLEHEASVDDLVLMVFELGDSLVGSWEYNTDLFDAGTIARMSAHYAQLLQNIVANPDVRLSELGLMTPAEERRIVVETNQTDRTYPDEAVHRVFEEQAARTPDAIAAVYGDETITYADLNRRANQLARLLRSRGVSHGALVGVLLDRSVDMIVSVLAILKAGGAYVPLDPSYPQNRLAFMIEDTGSPVILVHDHLAGRAPVKAESLIRVDSDRAVIDREAVENLPDAVTPDQVAYVIYTSGSTGTPKGVVIPHRGITRLVLNTDYVALDASDRIAQASNASFDAATFEIWGALLNGGTIVGVEKDVALSPREFADELRDRGITTLFLTTALFNQMSREAPAGFKTLRQVMFGGEACDPACVRTILEQGPPSRLLHVYGPTENTTFSSWHLVEKVERDASTVPIGGPLAYSSMYVLDRALRPVPIGVPGELYVGGDGLGLGYLNRPDLTADRFVTNPFSEVPGARLYRTGDLVRWSAFRTVEFLGRIDHQVKIRGFRIEPGEIEAVLQKHPAVRETIVLAREDTPGERRLVAYVVAQPIEPEANGPASGEWTDMRVEQWRKVYDDVIYEQVAPEAAADPTFNIAGWISSYTGRPIGPDGMREQVQQTTARMLAGRPKRVLEIGCGTGLLLFQVAPHCDEYFATDFSQVSLRYVGDNLSDQLRGRVHLFERGADDFSGFAPASFDLVVLNSVVQYFPSLDYLRTVIEGAIRVLAPGGRLFLGDIRSLPLLDAFYTAVQVFQAAPGVDVDTLWQRVEHQREHEQELIVAPEFFRALASEERVTAVTVSPKRGRLRNELCEFRYDVTIEVAGTGSTSAEAAWHDWSQGWTVERTRELLSGKPDAVGFTAVPNARVDAAVTALQLLRTRGAQTVEEVRAAMITAGIDPEDLWQLGEELDYVVDVSWASGRADGSCDVLFRQRRLAAGAPWFPGDESAQAAPQLSSDPVKGTMARGLVPQLRAYLGEKLPEYMVPSAFVVLDGLPLTPNGKVDRAALPAPDQALAVVGDAFVAPRSPIEEGLASIWVEVLGSKQIGVHDNFFELGGHSLLATQVISRVRAAFQVDLPLRRLFEAPTVAGLAQAIDALRASATRDVPIERRASGNDCPLSFAQERMWFLHQLNPRSAGYNMPLPFRLRGRVDLEALRFSLRELVRRHDALRTIYENHGGRPVGRLLPPDAFVLQTADLSNQADEVREAALLDLAGRESARPFDLSSELPIRATLVRLADRDHALFVTLHHIASDGWSLGVLTRELGSLYRAASQRETSPLPELAIQYADFAVWQREWLDRAIDDQIQYWRRSLEGAPTLSLPTDHPRPPAQTFEAGRRSVQLPKPLADAVRDLSRAEGVTVFMTLLAAFQILLGRYSGQRDIVVGTPIANRTRPEIEPLIGFFVNSLTLRTDLSGHPSFRDVLARVREVTLGGYAHQDVPFEKLVEALQPERDLSRNPLFQVMFALQNAPIGPLAFQDLTVEPIDPERTTTRVDIECHVWEHPEGLAVFLAYRLDLFEGDTMGRLLEHFGTLVSALVAQPDRSIEDAPLLSAAERSQLLNDWNDTRVDYGPAAPLHEMIEAQVAKTPDLVALSYESQSLTYAELDRRANQLAHRLIALGARPDTLVGICMDRSLEMVVSLLAVLKAGAAYVPIDPAYPAERIQFMLEDAAPRVVLTQERLLPLLSSTTSRIVCVDTLADELSKESSDRPVTAVTADSLAYVIFTSGSTGRPKGAMNTHRAIRNRLLWMQNEYGLTPADRVLQKTPFSFDVSVWEFFWPLLTGARLVVARPGGHQDRTYLADIIAEQQITTLHFVPSMLQLFLDEPNLERCGSLVRVICSGEALPFELQQRFYQRLDAELHNLYGPTEAAVDVTYWPCPRSSSRPIVPIGRPVANTQMYVLDERMGLVPAGVPGELHIGGIQVGRGYWNRPQLTAERFVPDPFSQSPGARLYKTGDLARHLPDGSIEYLARLDHQVKIRGLRIELGEIETAVAQHPAISEAVVVAREDQPGDKRLVAYIVAKGDVSLNELRDQLKRTLPDYMVPSAFVLMAEMPLSPNGKIDRRLLPAPDPALRVSQGTIVEPRTEVEEIVAEAFKETLNISTLSVMDSFFELGGHSLTATQLVSRLRDRLAVDLPLRTVFEAPTVASLAEVVEAALLDEIEATPADEAVRLVGQMSDLGPGQRT